MGVITRSRCFRKEAPAVGACSEHSGPRGTKGEYHAKQRTQAAVSTSDIRQAVFGGLVAIVGFGILNLGTWLWRPQTKARVVSAGQSRASSLVMSAGGDIEERALPVDEVDSRLPAGAPFWLASLPVGAEVTGHRGGHKIVARRLSERPHAFLLKNWLTQEECDALIKTAESHGLETAETRGETLSRRHCDVAVLSPREHDMVKSMQVDAARTLLSEEAMSLPGGGCEDLHVLRYQPGGEYKPHFDAANNPRVLTILYYLNGVGATWFPLAGNHLPQVDGYEGLRAHIASLNPITDGLRVEPTGPGDTLVFYNFDGDGHNDLWSLHAGLEVNESEGAKWIASHFFNVPALTEAHRGTDGTAA